VLQRIWVSERARRRDDLETAKESRKGTCSHCQALNYV